MLLPLIAVYAVASLLFVQYMRRRPSIAIDQITLVRWARAGVLEVWGLFVTDGALATFAVIALLFVTVFIDRIGGQRSIAGGCWWLAAARDRGRAVESFGWCH